MIPEFINIGSLWKVLPPGIHIATVKEIEARFATTNHRKLLFYGLIRAVALLYESGCTAIFFNGSYITTKPIPNDYDLCWSTKGVDYKKLDPVFFRFSNNRREQKNKYFGEFFPMHLLADKVHPFYSYFQIDRYTGKAKGIIKIDLKEKIF